VASYPKTGQAVASTSLLHLIPLLADTIALHPARIQAALYQAFDIQALYKDDMNQVSLFATITTSTPHAVAAILSDAGYDPTTVSPATTAPVHPLAQPPISHPIYRDHEVSDPDGSCCPRLRAWSRSNDVCHPAPR
jgi:hypothetical protein